MKTAGNFNASEGRGSFGLKGVSNIYFNLEAPALYEESLRREEGFIAKGGALSVETGAHTGRSAQDKFVVEDDTTRDSVWWDNNKKMSREQFDLLLADFETYVAGRDVFVEDLYGGADPAYRLPTRLVMEYAWHALFIRNLMIRPAKADLAGFAPEFRILCMPGFRADPARHGCRSETIIACDFSRRIVLIGGSSYAGEMKKSVFTFLNFLLPEKGVMPMHCSANVSVGGESALFFGLSGTGKTTLSADPNRILIGDDEHGWSPNGIFNFEGGCYAKTIRLSAEAEPEIYSTTQRFGTLLENVMVDRETRLPDFDDATLTENGRCAYPMEFIPNASPTGRAGHPRNLVMLTADAFGVMPPIAKLTPAQAMYHFLSGYTAKVAGTEKGVKGSQATFSTCFGAPFMPRHPSVYGKLLRQLIADHSVDCWLVNTGWTGGAYGVGSRMPIKATRALLSAALDGSLKTVPFYQDPNFGFSVPAEVPGIDPKILRPRETWADKQAYDAQATKLVEMFVKNFATFEAYVDEDVLSAAPELPAAAE
ncbi:phosphoenolpyruvate carboxykinase [Hartmannibacter diazotrophicus]|uniref:phosphoenolpyruvate carboxykinase n=1 Tax=Hartmannibacter diazotrophicus TaxID=1482074 RepID=UPI000C15E836|nr:phosphoenolpyruvate carboxykinase [Hartmannibacter diazotrophicus]